MVGGNTFMPMGGGKGVPSKGALPVGELTVGDGTNPAAASGTQGVIAPGSPEHKAIDKRIEGRKPELKKMAEEEEKKKVPPEGEEAEPTTGENVASGISAGLDVIKEQEAARARNRLDAPAAHRGQVTTPDLSFKGGGALSGMGGAF